MGLVRSIAALFSRFNNSPFPSTDSTENAAHALGRQGEHLAAKHLKRSRFKILYRNFRAPGGGEVDLVCRDLDTDELVFAEVKTRRTREFGDPSEAVNRKKQDLIARGAIAWLRMLDFPDICYRFDIVEVIITADHREVVIIKNAFTLPERYRT
jgi:putative endonuclease